MGRFWFVQARVLHDEPTNTILSFVGPTSAAVLL